jgi:hypothetical protein
MSRYKLALVIILLSTAIAYTAETTKPYQPKLPSKNAYDYYITAVQKLNAYWQKLPPDQKEVMQNINESDQPPSDAALRYLNANKEVIDLMDIAAKLSFWDPVSENKVTVRYSEYAGYRSLARLRLIQINHSLSEEDGMDVVQEFQEGMKLVQDIQKPSPLEFMVGQACEFIIINPVAKQIDYFSAKECKLIAQTLRNAESLSSIHKQGLTNDWERKRQILDEDLKNPTDFGSVISELFKDPVTGELSPESAKGKTDPHDVEVIAQLKKDISTPEGLKAFTKRITDKFEALHEKAVKELDKPLWEQTSVMDEIKSSFEIDNQLLTLFTPLSYIEYMQRYQARRQLLYLHLMLRVYKLKMGRYPKLLEELGNEMIIDPFSGKQFIYQFQGDTYRLYSVGQDGYDNKGIVTSPDREGPTDLFLLQDGSR